MSGCVCAELLFGDMYVCVHIAIYIYICLCNVLFAFVDVWFLIPVQSVCVQDVLLFFVGLFSFCTHLHVPVNRAMCLSGAGAEWFWGCLCILGAGVQVGMMS